MRKLLCVPIIHSEADLGSLKESIRTRYPSQEDWERQLIITNQFWDEVNRRIISISAELNYKQLRVYQDSLPVCGHENEEVKNMLRSIPPVTSTGPSRRKLERRPRRSIMPEESVKIGGEYKPLVRKKGAGRQVKVDKIHHPYQSFGEVDEGSKTIIFNLPLEEDHFSWKINGDILKIKSLRLDFQYKEEVRIPWEGQEPKVNFLNGVLSFSWGE